VRFTDTSIGIAVSNFAVESYTWNPDVQQPSVSVMYSNGSI